MPSQAIEIATSSAINMTFHEVAAASLPTVKQASQELASNVETQGFRQMKIDEEEL